MSHRTHDIQQKYKFDDMDFLQKGVITNKYTE
jgi:hypothetical protein